MAKMGPKAAVNETPLPFAYKGKPSNRLAAFSRKFLVTPTGKGAGRPLTLRPWQKELLGSVFDAKPQPRTAQWTMPRGSGKSTLVCVPALHELFCGEVGASIVCVAHNEKQARIIFNTAKRMVELNPELLDRCKIYEERLEVPGQGSSFVFLAATPDGLQGLNPSLGFVDESGVTPAETFDALALAAGKRERSTTIGIGTPSANPDSKLAQLREYGLTHPHDDTFVYREFSAAGFEEHAPDCLHCWQLSNPALGDFLFGDALKALLPPKMDEAEFRRVRLCQPVRGGGAQYLDPSPWADCADSNRIPLPGAPVVLGFDGSKTNDASVLVGVTVEARPIVFPVAAWTPANEADGYRVPILEVIDKIKAACALYDVREIACDPFLWELPMQLLEAEGYPVVSHPNTRERMAAPIAAFRQSVHEGGLTHIGDQLLTDHVLNAITVEHMRGISVAKPSPQSKRKIDALVAAIMAYGRATWHHNNRPAPSKLRVLKMRK